MREWLDAFVHCHEPGISGLVRICWPNGKSYFDQEAILIQIFDIMRDELGRMKNG